MKNILVVDDSSKTITNFNIINKRFEEFNIEINLDCDEIIEHYKNDKYEFIIIDHSFKESDKLMEKILSLNPLQKTILLSDNINCPIKCDVCLKNLKFVRLLKPIDIKEILHYLDETNKFLCPNHHVFDSINTTKKLYDFINLDENIYFRTKKIENNQLTISSREGSSIKINELEKIQNNINHNYFDLRVSEDQIIITQKL